MKNLFQQFWDFFGCNLTGGASSIDDDMSHSWGLGLSGIDSSAHELFEPSVNVDGTPMVGHLDAKGNPYGVTSDLHQDTSHDWAAWRPTITLSAQRQLS